MKTRRELTLSAIAVLGLAATVNWPAEAADNQSPIVGTWQLTSFSQEWLDTKEIEKWIEMGADVNARVPGYNRTPLITAASSEGTGPATLKLLLDKGADANAEDIDGERALDWAMYRQDQRKIEVLEQYGAKPGSGPRHQTYPLPGGIADARTSLRQSLSLLLPSAPVVFKKRGCITCHSQSMPQQVAAAAGPRV